MISCKRAAKLASEEFDRRLGFRDRLALRLHTFMCRNCKAYVRQLDFIKTACEQVEQRLTTLTEAQLSAEARARIIRKLSRRD